MDKKKDKRVQKIGVEPLGKGNDLGVNATYKYYKEPKIENTATDVYYNTEFKLPESRVAVPTLDAVIEAKEWVDEINKK